VPTLPYRQAPNEQAMVLAATAFARQHRRLRAFACTSSIGPGATNMLTGAATATVNRIPVLLPGDLFATRRVAPVLQQLERPDTQDVSVNDCFKPVSRYWDRINRPEQLAPAPGGAVRRTAAIDSATMFVEAGGEGRTARRIHHLLPPAAAAGRLLAFEVYTPGGNWSSFPPHKHDTDDPPRGSFLEELYYYRFARPSGFACQRVYSADRSLDVTLAVGDGDLVLRGYHVVAAVPGYDCYYLNIMAGPIRAWHFTVDPAHAWLMDWDPARPTGSQGPGQGGQTGWRPRSRSVRSSGWRQRPRSRMGTTRARSTSSPMRSSTARSAPRSSARSRGRKPGFPADMLEGS